MMRVYPQSSGDRYGQDLDKEWPILVQGLS